MTNTAAVIGLSYESHDLQQSSIGIFLEIKKGLWGPAEVRGTDWVVPGLDGQQPGNRRLHRRSIELRGYVIGSGSDEATQRSSFVGLMEDLQDWFDPTTAGTLTATLPGSETATIEARCVPPFVINQVGPAICEISIELESIDPDWVIGS